MDQPPTPARRSFFDPGWLFLIAGIALAGAVLIVGAMEELRVAANLRDRALAAERHRASRIERHEQYLAALRREDPRLVEALAAVHLNRVPSGRDVILVDGEGSSTSIFASLEPPAVEITARAEPDSLLWRLSTSDQPRLGVLALAGGLIAFGLLPATTKRDDEADCEDC